MIENKITDAIVPIYCDDDFTGTGFIYKSYLITAAHVVKDYEDIYYIYNGNRYSLNIHNRIYFELRGNERNEYGIISFDPDAEDLAIYNIETPCHDITIFGEEVQDGTDAMVYGFHYDSEYNISLRGGMVRIYNERDLGIISFWSQNYCMYCKKLEGTLNIIKGYSGGPLLVGNIVVGMLIENMKIEGYYHIMKAKHILETI